VIGVVVNGSAKIENGKGLATIKLSSAVRLRHGSKIRDGIIRNISVGYLAHARLDKKAKVAFPTLSRSGIGNRLKLAR
jgi:hypothetical protein